jgi:hypothetical protein
MGCRVCLRQCTACRTNVAALWAQATCALTVATAHTSAFVEKRDGLMLLGADVALPLLCCVRATSATLRAQSATAAQTTVMEHSVVIAKVQGSYNQWSDPRRGVWSHLLPAWMTNAPRSQTRSIDAWTKAMQHIPATAVPLGGFRCRSVMAV